MTADDNVKSITNMRLLENLDLELSQLTLRLFGVSNWRAGAIPLSAHVPQRTRKAGQGPQWPAVPVSLVGTCFRLCSRHWINRRTGSLPP